MVERRKLWLYEGAAYVTFNYYYGRIGFHRDIIIN
jgi:hypothetical protein